MDKPAPDQQIPSLEEAEAHRVALAEELRKVRAAFGECALPALPYRSDRIASSVVLP